MKIFAMRESYGISDISDEEDVEIVAEKIDIESNRDIRLDFSGCLIDYPATSKIVDRILNQLLPLDGKKTLEIITDYALPMETVANWIFIGSERLGLETNKGQSYEGLVKKLQAALAVFDIVLRVKIVDQAGETRDELTIPEQ